MNDWYKVVRYAPGVKFKPIGRALSGLFVCNYFFRWRLDSPKANAISFFLCGDNEIPVVGERGELCFRRTVPKAHEGIRP